MSGATSQGIWVKDELAWIDPILIEWRSMVLQYIDLHDGDNPDLPYWYNERVNIGLLAGAAWRAGFVALEEYQIEKGSSEDQISKGRNDLYVADSNLGALFEAKISYPSLRQSKQDELVRLTMTASENDVAKVTNRADYDFCIAANFFAPFHENEFAELATVENFLDGLQEAVKANKADAFAWVAPINAQKAVSHNGRRYPLVALALKIIP